MKEQRISREEAILALSTGKRGTVLLGRNKDGLLTCTYSTAQSYEVVYLRLLVGDQYFDEDSFNDYLFMRSHKAKDKTWYILLDQPGKTEIASINEGTPLICLALMRSMSSSIQNKTSLYGLKAAFDLYNGACIHMHEEEFSKLLWNEGEIMARRIRKADIPSGQPDTSVSDSADGMVNLHAHP